MGYQQLWILEAKLREMRELRRERAGVTSLEPSLSKALTSEVAWR